MTYQFVATRSQLNLARNERDMALFAASAYRRHQRTAAANAAPKAYRTAVDDNGRPMTIITHRHTGAVLDVEG